VRLVITPIGAEHHYERFAICVHISGLRWCPRVPAMNILILWRRPKLDLVKQPKNPLEVGDLKEFNRKTANDATAVYAYEQINEVQQSRS